MLANSWLKTSGILLFLISIFFVNWQVDRNEFIFIITFYSIAFAIYLYFLSYQQYFSIKTMLFIAILAHLLALIYTPSLSNDFYRFLWDGELTWSGYNPYDFTPKELSNMDYIHSNSYLMSLYAGMGELSQQNYSCYPTINQAYFVVATSLSSSLLFNLFVLKLSIVGTVLIGAIYLKKTLLLLKIDVNRMWMLYLNPLWIIEAIGNVHFEGVMISFLFIAFYFIVKKTVLPGSLFFALAIQIKLVPLLLLPFLFRFFSLKKVLLFYFLSLVATYGFTLVLINQNNFENFLNSIQLYFQVFEFNSFILHYYVQFGIAEVGWNMIKHYGPQLARISFLSIMVLALYGQIKNWQSLFKRMTIGFFIYLLLSSTIHPWYILPLVALSLFTEFGFALIWSYLVFLSYSFYAYYPDMVINVFRNIEYLLLFTFIVIEFRIRRPIFQFTNLKSKID